MNYSEIIDTVSEELNLPRELVDKTYKSFWRYIRESLQVLPLKQDLTEEEFKSLPTSYNIPSLGKLYVTWEKYVGTKQRFEYIRKIKEKSNEDKKH